MVPTTNKYLVVITGPTAVGKTASTIALAKAWGTEIISADSRQFYKEMAIGTAKPTKQELAEAPCHFVDFLSITTPYSAGQFARDALQLLEQLFRKHHVIILTGGSGLYLKALYEGLAPFPPTPIAIRKKVDRLYAQKGLLGLQSAFKKADPVYYQLINLQNPRRLMRALEVYYASGKPYSAFLQQAPSKPPFQVIKIGLNRPRAELYQRIDQRVEVMVEEGLFEEGASLYTYKALPALQTIGYREIFAYLEGRSTKAATVEAIQRNTRRYAKRQLTWFRREKDFVWFLPAELGKIQAYLQQKGVSVEA